MNVLVSFAYMSPLMKQVVRALADEGVQLMIDSGAFSVVKSGKSINHDAYIEYVREMQQYSNIEFVQFDKPKNAAVTLSQLRKERAEGLRTMPVFTSDRPTTEFADVVAEFGSRVCVAGGQGITPAQYIHRCNQCVGGKIHSLGFTQAMPSFCCSAYSYDSVSWASAGKYGRLHLWTPPTGMTVILRSQLVKGKVYPALLRELAASGVGMNTLASAQWGHETAFPQYLCASSWIRYAANLETAGKRLFFVIGAPFMLSWLLLACEHLLPNRGIAWNSILPNTRPIWDALHSSTWNLSVIRDHVSHALVKWRRLCE